MTPPCPAAQPRHLLTLPPPRLAQPACPGLSDVGLWDLPHNTSMEAAPRLGNGFIIVVPAVLRNVSKFGQVRACPSRLALLPRCPALGLPG